MGVSVSQIEFRTLEPALPYSPTGRFIQGLSLIARPGCFLARSTSHLVAARSDCTNIPLAAAWAQEDKTILKSGFSGHGSRRFVHWIRQG
jgi:hypothetical protein